MSKKVAVIMGSDSDLPIVKQAVQKLKEFNVPFEVHVMSAHRTPEDAAEFSKHAQENGFGVIISAAGKVNPSRADDAVNNFSGENGDQKR